MPLRDAATDGPFEFQHGQQTRPPGERHDRQRRRHPRERRERGHEQQRAPVEVDGVRTADERRLNVPGEHVGGGVRQHARDEDSGAHEARALREGRPRQRCAGRADRQLNGVGSCAADRVRQFEARHVGTCDEQKGQGGAHQHEQHPPLLRDGRGAVQWSWHCGVARTRACRRADTGTTLLDQGRHDIDRPARHDSRDRRDASEPARQESAGIERAPDPLSLVGVTEVRRHHADDHERFRCGLDLLADRTCGITEPLPCERFGNDDDLHVRLSIVPFHERTSPPRPRAEQLEQADCHISRLDQFRLTAAAEEDDFREVALDACKQISLLPPLVEQRNGQERVARPRCMRITFLDFDETFGVAVGDPMKHQRVRRREDERVRRQRDRQQRRCKGRAPAACSKIPQRPSELRSPLLRSATHSTSRVQLFDSRCSLSASPNDYPTAPLDVLALCT